MMQEKKEYVSYEYKEISAEPDMVPMLMDGYENFGWEITERIDTEQSVYNGVYVKREKIRMRRDRHIINKTELTRLERNFVACIDEIGKLEKSKKSKGIMYSLIIGVSGTIFMAGSVFAVTATPPNILLTILLAIPAFVGWILPYFVYKKIMGEEEKRLTPIIEEKYDEIDEICEKAHRLTNSI